MSAPQPSSSSQHGWAAPRSFAAPVSLPSASGEPFTSTVTVSPTTCSSTSHATFLLVDGPPEPSVEASTPSQGTRPRSASAVSSNATSKHNKDTFLWKLWNLLQNDARFRSLIHWSGKGTHIVIPDEARFRERVCRVIFAQTTIQSFNKQMNNWDFKRVKKGTDYSRIDDTIPHTARLWFHVSLNQRSTDADVAGVLRHPDGPAKKVSRRGPKRPTKASRKGRRSASRASSDEDDDDDFEEEELDELDADHEEEERAEKEVVARTPSPFVAEPVEPPAPAAAPTSPDCARCEPHVYFSVDEEQPTDWTTTESFSDGVSHQYTHFGDQLPPTSSTFARAGAGQYDIVTSNSAYSFPSFYETSQKAYAPYPSTFEHYASPRFYSTHSDTSQPSFHLPSSSPTAPTSPDHHHLSSQFLDTTLLPAPSQRHTSPIQRHPSSYYSAPLNPYTHPTYVSSISWPSTSHSSGELGTAAHAYVGPSQRRELSRSTTKGSLADASLGLSRSGSLRMMQDLWEQPRAARGY